MNKFEVKYDNHKACLLRNKEVIIPFFYDGINVCDDHIRLFFNGKWGIADLEGNIIIPCKYSPFYSFINGVALVGIDRIKYGFIDMHGKEIIPIENDEVYNTQIGLIIVKKGKKCGIKDINNNIVVPFIYKNISYLCGDLFNVDDYEKLCVINKYGEILFSYDYSFYKRNSFKTKEYYGAFSIRDNTINYNGERYSIYCDDKDKVKKLVK